MSERETDETKAGRTRDALLFMRSGSQIEGPAAATSANTDEVAGMEAALALDTARCRKRSPTMRRYGIATLFYKARNR